LICNQVLIKVGACNPKSPTNKFERKADLGTLVIKVVLY